MQSEEIINNVARRIYEDRHAGMNNIWNWDDNGLDDEHPGVRAQYEGYAKSAIAALSAAEPQPSPSVAVKALEWHGSFGKSPVGQAVCYRVMFNENGAGWGYPEKGRGYFAEQDSGFLVSGPHDTHAKAREAAQADYEARIRSALSAQVQDVAGNMIAVATEMKDQDGHPVEALIPRYEWEGWQLVPKEPTDEMLEAFRQAHGRKCVDIASHTPTEHPDDGGGPFGYGYRAMLAAAPAKQEGSALKDEVR